MRGLELTRAILHQAVLGRVFPGAVVLVGGSAWEPRAEAVGRLSYDDRSPAVDERTVYDLASLTKVLCTTTLVADLVARNAVGLDDPIARWSEAWRGLDRRGLTIRDLLLHSSGLPDHRPFFATLSGPAAFEQAIASEPLEYEPRSRSLYSDLGFILLGQIIERAGDAPLSAQFDRWWHREIAEAPPLVFSPPPEWRPRTAPTELDPWRGRLLCGEVHDENAAALGGVAGHAGLFGDAVAVARCAHWWLARASERPWTSFVQRGNVPGSSRALGWDTMLPTSSCGTRMSPAAFGHTGFTGTSLWIDPTSDRYVVFLANRVHPRRAGDAMRHVRPAVHDAVADDLTRE